MFPIIHGAALLSISLSLCSSSFGSVPFVARSLLLSFVSVPFSFACVCEAVELPMALCARRHGNGLDACLALYFPSPFLFQSHGIIRSAFRLAAT